MSAHTLLRIGGAMLLAAALAACEAGSSDHAKGGPPQMSREVASAPAAADAVAKPQAPAAPETPAPIAATTPMLAYVYSFGIEARPQNVRALEARHEAACIAAGIAQCQVTGSSVSEYGEGQVRGELALRATPAWLRNFRAGLPDDAKAAGGRVTRSEVSSEDLSRQIVDTEAALRARTTLRDRLQELLASHPGKLSDLLDVERELARVQGEIDATQSELAMMRGRVATSEVTLEYSSAGGVASAGVWSPLTRAFGEFFGIIAGTLGVMVNLVAVLAPWILVLGGLIWLFRKRMTWLAFWRRKPPPPADPPA